MKRKHEKENKTKRKGWCEGGGKRFLFVKERSSRRAGKI
jgi:hypothetical protein